jgi:hypothetical protein
VTNFADINSWMDVIGNFWVGLVLIAVAVIPAFISAKNHSGIKKIQDQVVNGHKEPLRNDLDKVIKALSETADKVDNIALGLNGLREELFLEEGRRRSNIKELREDIDRKFGEVAQRFIK